MSYCFMFNFLSQLQIDNTEWSQLDNAFIYRSNDSFEEYLSLSLLPWVPVQNPCILTLDYFSKKTKITLVKSKQ